MLSGKLLSQETAVINQRVIRELKNAENLTMCKWNCINLKFKNYDFVSFYFLIYFFLFLKIYKHVMDGRIQQMNRFGIF